MLLINSSRILLQGSSLLPYSLAFQQQSIRSCFRNLSFLSQCHHHFHQKSINSSSFKSYNIEDEKKTGLAILDRNFYGKNYFYQSKNLFHSQSVLNNNFTGGKVKSKSKDEETNLKKNIKADSDVVKEKDSKEILSQQPAEKEEKLGLIARFKKMTKEYWYVLIPVHVFTSCFWFGGFYYASICGVDIIGMLEQLNFSEKIINPLRDSHLGHIAIAYLLYKIATPARYTVTLGGTTFAIKVLVKRGWIKPMPSKNKLVQMYKDKKDDLQQKVADKKIEMQEKFKKD